MEANRITLLNIIEMWEMQNPNVGFFDECAINSLVNKKDLLDYLLLEYGELEPVDAYSNLFHKRVANFFKIHKWNIDKLVESQNFKYKPLDTYHGSEHRTEDISTVENVDTGVSYEESGNSNANTVNLVSAFNDVRSPNGKEYIDSEHDRQETTSNYDKDGSSDTDMDRTQDVNENENTTREGKDGNSSYQSLIEEERQQAQFNLYKWIAKHFSIELLVCVW